MSNIQLKNLKRINLFKNKNKLCTRYKLIKQYSWALIYNLYGADIPVNIENVLLDTVYWTTINRNV